MSGDGAVIREGDVLAGKYRVEKVLGAGGMGVVVAAHHIGLDTKVAIKFLLPEMLGNRDAVARFATEARAAVRIKSEYVARVFDVGILETGAPYMVMEFLDGGDLAAWLEQRGWLPIDLAVEFILQVCVAVADAHALGIVHRDLKPANFFCVRRSDGQLSIKVLDFGISKVTGDSSGQVMSVTRTNSVMGSPLYMSPEQLRSPKDVDAQTDIWSIGASLYELLTGTAPFQGDTIAELAVRLASHPPPPLRVLRPEIPPVLEAVVLKCLERDRVKRYQNVAELAVALLQFAPRGSRAQVERISAILRATGLATTGMSLPPSRQPTNGDGVETFPPVGKSRLSVNRTRQLAGIAGVAAVLGVLTAFAFVTLRSKSTDKPRAPAAPASEQGVTVESPSAPSAAASGAASTEPRAAADTTPLAGPSPPSRVGPKAAADEWHVTPPPQRPEMHVEPRPRPVETRAPGPPAPAAKVAPSAPETVVAPEPKQTTSCSPPFYFDDKGARVFKKECVH